MKAYRVKATWLIQDDSMESWHYVTDIPDYPTWMRDPTHQKLWLIRQIKDRILRAGPPELEVDFCELP